MGRAMQIKKQDLSFADASAMIATIMSSRFSALSKTILRDLIMDLATAPSPAKAAETETLAPTSDDRAGAGAAAAAGAGGEPVAQDFQFAGIQDCKLSKFCGRERMCGLCGMGLGDAAQELVRFMVRDCGIYYPNESTMAEASAILAYTRLNKEANFAEFSTNKAMSEAMRCEPSWLHALYRRVKDALLANRKAMTVLSCKGARNQASFRRFPESAAELLQRCPSMYETIFGAGATHTHSSHGPEGLLWRRTQERPCTGPPHAGAPSPTHAQTPSSYPHSFSWPCPWRRGCHVSAQFVHAHVCVRVVARLQVVASHRIIEHACTNAMCPAR